MSWLYTKLTLLILLGALVATTLYALIFKLDLQRLPSIHFPVMFVNNHVFWLDDIKNVQQILIKSFNVSSNEAFPLIKKVIIEQSVIKSTAKDNNIKPIPLSDTKILTDNQEAEKAEKLAKELYGWSMDKFNQLVIQPLELRRGVANWYYLNNNESFKQELLNLKKSINNVEDFNKIDQVQYMGFVELKTLPLNMQAAILELSANQISDVVESNDAYHLVYLQSYLVNNGVYEISVITKPKKLFQTWLDEQAKNYRVYSFVK